MFNRRSRRNHQERSNNNIQKQVATFTKKETYQQGYQPPKLTVPQSPQFHTDTRLEMKRKYVETTEEQQLRAIQEEIEFLNRKRKFAEQRMQAALENSYPIFPERAASEAPLTIPEGFSFKTDERIQRRHMNEESDNPQPTSAKRRKHHPSGLTVPEPFSFLVDERAAFKAPQVESHSTNPFIPMAQQTLDFQRKTPRRLRKNKNRGKGMNNNKRSSPNPQQRLTVPEPFHFEVDERLYMKPKE
jgi:hypothetical protein